MSGIASTTSTAAALLRPVTLVILLGAIAFVFGGEDATDFAVAVFQGLGAGIGALWVAVPAGWDAFTATRGT